MSENSLRIFNKEHLQNLCDGVFAVVLTLLVLDLISDRLTDARTAAELEQALLDLWPKLLSYLISFAVAAYFWVAQHTDLSHIEKTDKRYIWLTILFLFWISLVPFSAALLGEHHQHAIAELVYGGNMILATLTLHGNWSYVLRQTNLMKADLDQAAIRRAHRRLLLGPPIYLLAIGLAYVRPHASFVLYVLTACLYVISGIIPDWLRLKALASPDDTN